MNVETRELGESGISYYFVQRRYPDGATAKQTFDRLMVASRREQGKLDLGVYRIVPNGRTQPGGEACVIAVVSLRRKGVAWASSVMGGEPTDVIEPAMWDALLARRARVVTPIYRSGERPEGGQVLIRRGARGAFLRPDGTMDERVGGDE